MMEPFPERPKGMHRRTYDRIWAKAHALEYAMNCATLEKFGIQI